MDLVYHPTDCERLLAALRLHSGEFVPDLYRLGLMVHSRISDLRAEGHTIECRRFGRKDYRYRLIPPAVAGAAVAE